MAYHFKQTIVVKREQEIPNYTVQRTMIRKTTQAHKAQEGQSEWKIKKSIIHIQSPCSFYFFPASPHFPPHPAHKGQGSFRPCQGRNLWIQRGKSAVYTALSDTLEISGLQELVQACHSFHNI